jgi:hypothetical protein
VNGRRTLAATLAPSVRPASLPQLGALPCLRSLKASRKTAPWRRFGLFPDMERAGSAELALSSAGRGRLGRSPLVKTRRPPRACSVCRGQPSASRSGSAVSTLIWKVFGLRRYRPGRFVGEAAMMNARSLARTRRFMSPHVFAIVMARSGRLPSTLRPMAPSTPTRITRKPLEPRSARGHGSRREPLTPRWRHVRRLTPQRSEVRGPPL